jgi:hypothetical protein
VPGEESARRRDVILVMTATVLWSPGVFARLLSHLDLWTVMGWRATLGAASISVIGIVEWRRGRMDESFGFGWLSPVVAALALIAISAYVAALMTTTVADVMIMYASPQASAGSSTARRSRPARLSPGRPPSPESRSWSPTASARGVSSDRR